MDTPEQMAQVVADQRQAEADAAARRDFLAAHPEGLVAGTIGHTNEPVIPPDGPVSGLHWMGT